MKTPAQCKRHLATARARTRLGHTTRLESEIYDGGLADLGDAVNHLSRFEARRRGPY